MLNEQQGELNQTFVGLKVETVRIGISTKQTYEFVLRFFSSKLKISKVFGKGLIVYAGLSSQNGSIFMGVNPKFEAYTLIFEGGIGVDEFEIFRKDFLNLAQNSEYVKHLNISRLEASYVSLKTENMVSVNDFTKDVETFVQLQQKSVPKVTIEKGTLYIGGRTGATSLSIKADTNVDLTVNLIVVTLKIKGNSGLKFFELLLSSIDCSINTVIAYAILTQFARSTLYGCTKIIHTNLIKEFEVGKVVTYAQAKNKSNTSSGKYLIRSLSGIRTKLKKKEFTQESTRLFLDWFEVLYNVDSIDIKESKAFFDGIQNILTPVTPAIGLPKNSKKNSNETV